MNESIELDLGWVYENNWECFDERVLGLLSTMSLMLAYPNYGTEEQRKEVVAAVWHMLSYEAQMEYEIERLELER